MTPSLGLGPTEPAQSALRPIHTIARDIRATPWMRGSSVSASWARPYLTAMSQLSTISDSFGHDSARTVLLYFLSNVQGFKGLEARKLKNELRAHLGEKPRD